VRSGQPSKTAFLDKLCIHQTDIVKKLKGINAIGAYLIRTKGLTILWDPTYFTRLWCVFEVAVFLRLNPYGTIDFVPITYGCVQLCGHAFTCFVVAYRIIFGDKFGLTAFFHFIMNFVIELFLRWHRNEMKRIPEFVSKFEAKKANCFSEDDRAFVENTIESLYGSLSNFDSVVQTRMVETVRNAVHSRRSDVIFGLEVLYPYYAHFLVFFVLCEIPYFGGASGVIRLRLVLYGLSLCCRQLSDLIIFFGAIDLIPDNGRPFSILFSGIVHCVLHILASLMYQYLVINQFSGSSAFSAVTDIETYVNVGGFIIVGFCWFCWAK